MSEIGSFFNACVTIKKEEKIESLVFDWISSHYEPKDFKEFVLKIENTGTSKNQSDKKITNHKEDQEVRKEWSRLASFMSGMSGRK